MSIWEDLLEGKSLTGIAIGIGAVTLAPIVVPVVASVVKPAAKAAIKGGIILYDKGREIVADTVEVTEDLVAEARSELQAGAAMATAGAGAGMVAQKERGRELTGAPEQEAPKPKGARKATPGEELSNA